MLSFQAPHTKTRIRWHQRIKTVINRFFFLILGSAVKVKLSVHLTFLLASILRLFFKSKLIVFNIRKKKVNYNVEWEFMAVFKTVEEHYSCGCRSSTDVLLNANSHILTLIWKVLLWSDQIDAGLASSPQLDGEPRKTGLIYPCTSDGLGCAPEQWALIRNVFEWFLKLLIGS